MVIYSDLYSKDSKHTRALTFENFGQKNPVGTITDDSVQVYEDGLAYLHTGMYTFELGQGADRKVYICTYIVHIYIYTYIVYVYMYICI